MPIVEKVISKEIVDFITQGQDKPLDNDSKDKIQKFGDNLAKVIANAIKSATVTVNPGIQVSTTGTAVAQTGVTTSPGSGKLS